MAWTIQTGTTTARGVRSCTTLSVLLLALLLFAPGASANTSLFSDSRICGAQNCQALSFFGVLFGGDGTNVDTLNINGGWTFSSGIAVGGSSDLSKVGTNSTNDIIDYSNAVVTNSNCSGSNNYCGSGTITGGSPTNANATRVTNGLSQYDSILTKIAALANITAGNGTQLSLPTSGTRNIETDGPGAGGIKIYRNAGAFTQSNTITLGCGGNMCNANDLVIISMGGNMTLNRDFTLADGLTPDQVIFYIPSNTLTINPGVTSNISVSGAFLMGSNNASIGDSGGGTTFLVNMNGRVYSNTSDITFTNKGGTFTDPGISSIPEASTWALMAGGFGVILWTRFRKDGKRSDSE